MASLSLQHITKRYPNGFEAVKDFNLEIADKEFIIFVGPSGCGKSTTLRMIAGLEEISDGTLKIDDKVVNDVEPKDRDIAMVFQNYKSKINISERKVFVMGMTMTQKILANAVGKESVKAGELIMANLNLVLGNDITTPVAIGEFAPWAPPRRRQ